MSDIVTTLDNIVAHWNLNEESGTRADETANGNDLTDNNTVGFGTGLLGNAADFEESNSEYLSIADGSQSGLDITGDISVSFWIKFESLTDGASQAVVSKYSDNQRSYFFQFRRDGSDYKWRAVFSQDGSAATSGLISVTDSTLSTGVWYHVVMTFDVSTSTLQVYRNGSSVGSSSGSAISAIMDDTGTFAIGCNEPDDTPTQFVDGLVQHVTITSDLISSGEASTLYNSGTPLPYEDAGGYTQDLSETASLTETKQFEISHAFSESHTLTDSFSSVAVKLLDTADGLTASDNVAAKITGRVLAETITAADTVAKTLLLALSEAASLVDSIANQVYVSLELTEAVSLVENVLYKLNGVNALWRDIYTDTTDAWSDIYNDV